MYGHRSLMCLVIVWQWTRKKFNTIVSCSPKQKVYNDVRWWIYTSTLNIKFATAMSIYIKIHSFGGKMLLIKSNLVQKFIDKVATHGPIWGRTSPYRMDISLFWFLSSHTHTHTPKIGSIIHLIRLLNHRSHHHIMKIEQCIGSTKQCRPTTWSAF